MLIPRVVSLCGTHVGRLLKKLLRSLEQINVNDGVVLALEDFLTTRDATCVKDLAQEPGDGVFGKTPPPSGTKSTFVVEPFADGCFALPSHILLENKTDDGGFLLSNLQNHRIGVFDIAKGSSMLPEALLGLLVHPVFDALGNQLPFVLGKRKKHVEHQASLGGACVEVLGCRCKIRLDTLKQGPKLMEVSNASRYTVNFVCYDHIDVPFEHIVHELLDLRPLKVFS